MSLTYDQAVAYDTSQYSYDGDAVAVVTATFPGRKTITARTLRSR